MDATQYKDYVLFMLFIKYVSDKYADTDDFAPAVVIPAGAGFKDMVALKGNPNIGEKINTQVIQSLIEANSKLARSDFPDFDDPTKLGEGDAKVKRISNLIGIFQKPELDFSQNRAENDDILGDAYEYLMRHFATQSGKSKGQFYTPSEVSRIIASVIGISHENTVGSTTVYDPTCGSGSLLLKVAAQAERHITLEGQEKDVTTAGLARMNMILHDFPSANILAGDTLAAPKFLDEERLRTYDYVVANPPFSDKQWSTGVNLGEDDKHKRWAWGNPPAKQGDYAYLLHIIRSMKGSGKAACILPHGVLFRGNAEAAIREKLVRSGILKGIIGLPANLFYGTGIPACIVVLDKENAANRHGIFMIDASKGFKKDGPKNRLRSQDIHRIVDAFTKGQDIEGYARMVPFNLISSEKNAFNLNLPRYIDSSEPEDLQDINGHLRGGIPERDIDGLSDYWDVVPSVRAELFEPFDRPGYYSLRVDVSELKPTIFANAEFLKFKAKVDQIFADWRKQNTPHLNGFAQDGLPKDLIHTISENLLTGFKAAPLMNAYDVYQYLMDYWAEQMQDDCYLIAADGWTTGVQPREIVKIKNKDNKLAWPEPADYLIGARRFKSDLVPASILVARYFTAEQAAIDALDVELSELEQKMTEAFEEGSGEEGLLVDAIEGDEGKQKVAEKLLNARLKQIKGNADFADEAKALSDYKTLLDAQKAMKKKRKDARTALDKAIHEKYPALTEDEVKVLVIADKWLTQLGSDIASELDRTAQRLTGRVRELAERYETSLPDLDKELVKLSAKVADHLRNMGATWE
ncbi:type I restriction-modification system subunit M [Pseudohalocynthiibacter sp. F2068]|nr:type I restriction-modification system subunit M [Pseudohalocynthiibacter sp. F2068]